MDCLVHFRAERPVMNYDPVTRVAGLQFRTTGGGADGSYEASSRDFLPQEPQTSSY